MASIGDLREVLWGGGVSFPVEYQTTPPPRDKDEEYKHKFYVALPECNREYRHTKEGVLVWAVKPYTESSMFGRAEKDYDEFEGIALLSWNTQARPFGLEKKLFRRATPEEIERHLARVKVLQEEAAQFHIGLPIETKTTIEHEEGFLFFRHITNFWQGTEGVVDTNYYLPTAKPKEVLTDDGDDDDEDDEVAEAREQQERKDEKLRVSDQRLGAFHLRELLPPQIRVYFPEAKQEILVEPRQIKPKKFNKDLINQLILADGVKERIQTVLSRVLDKKAHASIYNKLGLAQLCSKGRGAIILMHGAPGSGKTMTAEAFSDYVEKPLIRIEANDLANPQTVRANLVEAFRRVKKYDGILLIDEVDVFIRRRGHHPMLDEMTSVFLRTLEYFDGIIFMTTNLVGNIDTAIFSRMHLTVGIEEFDPNHRRAIWKGMMNAELLNAITGNEAEKEKMFDRLAEIKLNGREIKNVIQNVVTHAVVAVGGKEKIKEARWIPRNYFIEESEALAEQRQILKRDYSGK